MAEKKRKADSTLTRRRVGRPRAGGCSPDGDPAEEILRAAARLFTQQGFVGTSTRQIAEAVGLRQSAIFHWFPTKESILETLFSQGWDRSLRYFREINKSNIRGSVKLCLSLLYDANFVAGAEPHIKVMIVPPELRQPKFNKLLQKRRELISLYATFIEQAVKEGDFRPVDPAAAARMVLAIDEVVLDVAAPRKPPSPRAHAQMVVDFALHALVDNRRKVELIQKQVRNYADANNEAFSAARRA